MCRFCSLKRRTFVDQEHPHGPKLRREPDIPLGVRHDRGEVVFAMIHRVVDPAALFDFVAEIQHDHLFTHDPVVADADHDDRIVGTWNEHSALGVQV